MRAMISVAVLLACGADYPRHRRFMQPNLPSAPTTLLPAYSSGTDFLHPNNAGSIVYASAVADVIP